MICWKEPEGRILSPFFAEISPLYDDSFITDDSVNLLGFVCILYSILKSF